MEIAVLVALVMAILAVFDVVAMVFGTDSRELLDDDWRHDGRSRAQI